MERDRRGPAVRLAGVVKTFGEVRAVDGLDLEVPVGITFGLLGPNGAGKSTVMRLLTGTAVASEGHVDVLGMPMPGSSRVVRSRTGLVPQLDNLDEELSCRENLEVYARLYRVPRSERADAVTRGLAIARLEHKAEAFVGELSGGMRRRLLIARGLLHRPDLVLLDEPTVGLDPQVRQALWSQIEQIRATGATVVLTTHYIEEAERLCDQVAIVDHGRLLALDTPRGLMAAHVRSDIVVEVLGDDARQRRVQDAARAAGVVHRSAGTAVALFTDVVVEVLGDDARQRRVQEAARAAGVVHRSAGTAVALFTDDVGRLDGIDGLRKGDLEHRLRRPANLEDVFVSLTGEALR